MASFALRNSFLRTSRLSLRQTNVCTFCRYYADSTPAPTLLPRLRTDLKTAMRAKDTDRLNVLRSLLAEVTNASKTANPIESDLQVLSLLRKRASAAKAASAEFEAAGRSDLVEREARQANIIDEYAGGVETMSESDIADAVSKVLEPLKAAATGKVNMGQALKKLLGAGGSLEGKSVEKSEVARLVKKALGQ